MESNQSLATKTTAPSTFNNNLGARSPNVDTEWKTATRDDVAGSEYTRLQSLRSSMACRSKDRLTALLEKYAVASHTGTIKW